MSTGAEKRQAVDAYLEAEEVGALLLEPDDFDEAILGIARIKGHQPIIIYDYAAVVAIYARDMGEEDAVEFVEFNTVDAYMGEGTPGFLVKPWG